MKKSLQRLCFQQLVAAGFVLGVISGCGSGGSSPNATNSANQSQQSPPVTAPQPAATFHTPTVFFSLAPVDNGTCHLYDLADITNANDLSGATPVASAVSLAGSVSFPSVSLSGPALIQCSGGTYDDEATPGIDATSAPIGLRSVVELQANGQYVVSLATHLAAHMAKDNLSAALGESGTNRTMADLLGLDGIDITTEVPINLNTTEATANGASKYALVLGAFSQWDRDDDTSDANAFVQRLEADATDADGLSTATLTQAMRNLVAGDSAAGGNARGANSPVQSVNMALGTGASNFVAATGVEITGAASIMVGGSASFKASVLPANASSPLVTWTSSDAAIATVSEQGMISAHQLGQVVLTAVSRGTDPVSQTHLFTVVSAVASDTVAPAITLQGASTLTLALGENYADPGVSAADDRDGDLTSKIVVGGDSVNTAVAGTYVVSYSVSDNSGNAATQVTRTITVAPSTATVVAKPASGHYQTAQTVTLVSTVAGSTIYYTVDGSAPSAASSVYANPISITKDTELKFFSRHASGATETAVTQAYVIDSVKPVTTASVASGTYTSTFSVILSVNETGADIYYSLKGGSEQKYAAPLSINATSTLAFFAKDQVGNQEASQTRSYVIDLPPVITVTPAGGVFGDPVTVQVTATDATPASIYCTTDGSQPSSHSPSYTSPFTFSATTNFQCVAIDASGYHSDVASHEYRFDDTTPPVIAHHRNLAVLANESIPNETAASRAPSLNTLTTDNLSSSTKLQFKVVNYAELPAALGISLGMGGTKSASFAMTRPGGNELHVQPQAGYAGQATVIVQAKDEAGNESVPISINVAAVQACVDSDGDGLPHEVEVRLEMDPLKAGDDVGSNSAEDQYVMHVLNRLTYRPTASLVQQVKAVGVESWIADQLRPELIPARGSFAPEENAAQHLRDNTVVFYLADRPFEYGTDRFVGARPVLAERQLQAVMGQFWDNHFSTDLRSHLNPVAELYEEDMFYENALGSFEHLLTLSSKSYAMLKYLNGVDNKRSGPNENYGREVLELHTLGVGGGYSEDDVAQMSRIFTGWSHRMVGETSRFQILDDARNPGLTSYYAFQFNPDDHDNGLADYDGDGKVEENKAFFVGRPEQKIIVSLSGGDGVKEGEEAIAMMARHPSTARFICTKLAVKFVAESPNVETLDACARTFLNAQQAPNQIAQVLATLFASQQFTNEASQRAKLKDAQELLYGFVRLGLNYDSAAAKDDQRQAFAESHALIMGRSLGDMQMQPFGNPAPDGWSEFSDAWLSGNQMLQRQRQVNESIPQLGRLREYAERVALRTGRELIAHFFLLMLGGDYTNEDILLAYKQLYADEPFNMAAPEAEEKLRNLLRALAAHPNHNLQ